MTILLQKLHNKQGIARMIGILLVLVLIMVVVVMIPFIIRMNDQGETVACAHALDSARRQLAACYMLDGFEDYTTEDVKRVVGHAMNGWDDLCPQGGTVYVVKNKGSEIGFDIVCGLHGSDSKQCTRLNADHVLEELKEQLRKSRLLGVDYPETLTVTLHHKPLECHLVDQETGFKRGTKLTPEHEDDGIVAYYGIVGHSSFGAGLGEEGSICYFSFADETHCANWRADDGWTGDSYRN